MAKRSNGEGTIYKRKDGRWCGAYFDEQYNRHYVYAKSQTEVKKKLKEKQSQGTLKHKSYLFQDWISDFLVNYKKNELRAGTYDRYRGHFRKHIQNSWIGNMKLENIKSGDLQKYYNQKLDEGYNSKTVRAIEVIINEALNMAFMLRMIPQNPNLLATIPKKVKYEAKILTMDEIDIILTEAQEEELYPLVVTALYTGMRKGEIMALKWENIDFEEKRIYVKNSLCRVENENIDEKGRRHAVYQIMEPKTKKSIRIIPMLDEVYAALIEQKKRQEVQKEQYQDIYLDQGFVFADLTGNYLPQRQFMDKYHSFLKKYGITDIRFHDLRHTFATLLIESDVSMKLVQELLGHSTISTSMDIYAHVSERKKEQAIRQLRVKNKDR